MAKIRSGQRGKNLIVGREAKMDLLFGSRDTLHYIWCIFWVHTQKRKKYTNKAQVGVGGFLEAWTCRLATQAGCRLGLGQA